MKRACKDFLIWDCEFKSKETGVRREARDIGRVEWWVEGWRQF
jgi:hypothetical protein